MDSAQTLIISCIGIYFVIMICIGLYASRNQSYEGFVIGSRNVGYIPTIGSLASSFRDGSGVIFWFGFAMATGYGGLWLFVGVILGLLFHTIFSPKIRDMAAKNDYITIGEIIREKIGAVTERSTALIIIVFSLMLIAIQLYVSGNMFSAILGVDAWVGVCSVAVVVGFYLFLGGYSCVVKTDAVQFFLIISLIVIPFFFRPSSEQVLNFSSIHSLGAVNAFALSAIGFLYVLSSAETWQRVFSARNKKVIRIAFPASGIFLVIMTLSLIFLGMASKPFLVGVDPDMAFFEIFKGDFIPALLQAYIAVIVMAICMSTLDTSCYLTSATIAKNYLPAKVTKTRDSYIKLSRVVMIFILIFMSIVALTISDIIVFLFDAISLLYILSPVYIVSVLGLMKSKSRKLDYLITSSVVLSTAVFIYMFINNMFAEMIMVLVPVVINTVLVVGTIIYNKYSKQ